MTYSIEIPSPFTNDQWRTVGTMEVTVQGGKVINVSPIRFPEQDKIEAWCIENCKDSWKCIFKEGFLVSVDFARENDAALFKLFWTGPHL
jgi:hypothetical protein